MLEVAVVDFVAVAFVVWGDPIADDDEIGSALTLDIDVAAAFLVIICAGVVVAEASCTPVTFTLENAVNAALFPHSYLAVIL